MTLDPRRFSPMRWSPEQMDRLEGACRRHLRVALMRRGGEQVVVAQRVGSLGSKEAFIGLLPMTGEELAFPLDEIEHFEVVGE